MLISFSFRENDIYMSSYTLDRYYNGRLVSKRPPKMQRHHSLRSDYNKPREYHREHLFLEAGVSKKKIKISDLYIIYMYTILTGVNHFLLLKISNLYYVQLPY